MAGNQAGMIGQALGRSGGMGSGLLSSMKDFLPPTPTGSAGGLGKMPGGPAGTSPVEGMPSPGAPPGNSAGAAQVAGQAGMTGLTPITEGVAPTSNVANIAPSKPAAFPNPGALFSSAQTAIAPMAGKSFGSPEQFSYLNILKLAPELLRMGLI